MTNYDLLTMFVDISLDELAQKLKEEIYDCNKCPIRNLCANLMDFATDDCFNVWKKYLSQEVKY